MVVSCLMNMELGGSSRQTEGLMKSLQKEGFMQQDQRIPTNSCITKYGYALDKLAHLQIEEFVKNSQQLQIGFG